MQNVHPLKANPVNPWIAVPCYNDANKQKPEIARLKTELPSLLPCQRQQTFRDSNSREIIIENEHLRLRICIVPTLSAWGYVHKFIKLLDMNVTAFPPSHPVMENSRTRMVLASTLMVILFFECLAAPFISAYLGVIQIDYLLGRRWSAFLHICIAL